MNTARTLIAIASLILTPTLFAQISENKSATSFQEAHPATAFFVDQDGDITRVYGKAFSHGNSPTESADSFKEEWSSIWQCDSTDLISVGKWGNGHHLQPIMFNPVTDTYKFTGVGYTQTFKGIPVYGSSLTLLVRNESNFPTVLASANLYDLTNWALPNKIPHSSIAVDTIKKSLHGVRTITTPALFVYMADGPHLAFISEAVAGNKADGTYEKWMYFIDAINGSVIHRENRILHAVDGTISANATQGSGADECEVEIIEPMPYALITGGGESVFADALGNYTLATTSGDPVTVTSQIQGEWFNVNNQIANDSSLSMDVEPEGSGNFVHNFSNSDEFYRAEVNAYIESNVVRDFVLNINPDFPTIGDQTNWPVNVNINDSCNAYYDYSSINFYRNTGGCNNTAFSVIVHHEYGHHLVAVAGSGQGEYGEGMGDVLGVLITGDSQLGRGFYEGNCEFGIRNADNGCQFSATNCSSCGSEIHSCGQLISGCVWDMLEYFSFHDEGFEIVGDLAVNSILLHNGTSIDTSIAIDFITLDDDDGDIGNGSPNYQAIEFGFEEHGINVPQLDYLFINLASELPQSFNPQGGYELRLEISNGIAELDADTVEIFFADGNGLVVIYPLNEEGDGTFTFEVPPVDCGNTASFWFIARTTDDVLVFYPENAPDEYFDVVSASEFVVVIDDDFEEDLGWVVTGDSPTGWQRGVPQQQGGNWIPHADYDGSGQCYVTGNNGSGGGNDLELTTILTSPIMDASSGGTLSWAYWLSERPNNPHGVEDDFQMLASNDGENWIVIKDYDDYLPNGGWRTDSASIEVGGDIEPSATLQIRFLATDIAPDNRIEAGLDAVSITGIVCDETDCYGDTNGDGTVNVTDLLAAIADWGMGDSPADINEDGIVNVSDLLAIIDAWGNCP